MTVEMMAWSSSLVAFLVWFDVEDLLVHTLYAEGLLGRIELPEDSYGALNTPFGISRHSSFARRDVRQRTWSMHDWFKNLVHDVVNDWRTQLSWSPEFPRAEAPSTIPFL